MAEVYLDHNATTPLDPAVLDAMLPYLREGYGNASCGHRLGRRSRAAIDQARRDISEFLGCARDEIIFTSGGTEANNLAIKGAAWAYQERGKHIVVGAAEHASVTAAARFLERFGFEISAAPVDEKGQIHPDELDKVLRKDTALVSIMTAQNVVGTINRVDELAEVLAGRRILFHSDAAQAVGKIPTAFPFSGADIMTLAAHKFYGPKGVGAVILRRGRELAPLFHGAGHEAGRRSGTENTAGIVGLAAAIRLARSRMASAGERMVALRDAMHLRLCEELGGVELNGHPLDRLPNTLNLSFAGVSGKEIAERVPELLLATGPACHDRSEGLSPTFRVMGLSAERSSSSLRISLGRGNTWKEIQQAVLQLADAVQSLRQAANFQPVTPSQGPRCPRCEVNGLRLELSGVAPAMVCERHPTCSYENYLAPPKGSA